MELLQNCTYLFVLFDHSQSATKSAAIKCPCYIEVKALAVLSYGYYFKFIHSVLYHCESMKAVAVRSNVIK